MRSIDLHKFDYDIIKTICSGYIDNAVNNLVYYSGDDSNMVSWVKKVNQGLDNLKRLIEYKLR